MKSEGRRPFQMKCTNYAHRGASEYFPENTLLSFYSGICMGADGIETDVRQTRDGALVLFHDRTLMRMTGEAGTPEDCTLSELRNLRVKKNGFCERIVTLKEFLEKFSHFDLTFAIELKGEGVEEDTARLLQNYRLSEKTVVTSFSREYLERFRTAAPQFQIGYLTSEVTEETLSFLRAIGAEELCPKAEAVTPEKVALWHEMGFRVRAWGVSDTELMRRAYLAGVDGMTVNFPDRLKRLIEATER